MKCQICLREPKKLRFQTKRISICHGCVSALNEYHEVVEPSYNVLRKRYRDAVIRNANLDMQSEIPSIRSRAQWALDNIEEILAKRLPDWFNKIVADPTNTAKEYKIIRAHRRGLLHFDDPRTTKHPDNFTEIGKKIKIADELTCIDCKERNVEVHTHHIIYKSNFGTDRKQNLVTLCRHCHEKEHGRNFDFGENIAPTENHYDYIKPHKKIEKDGIKESAPRYTKMHLKYLHLDPEMMNAGIKLSGAYIESGVCDFKQFANAMIADLGDTVRPHLLSFYEGVRNWPGLDTTGMTEINETCRLYDELMQERPTEIQDNAKKAMGDISNCAGTSVTKNERADEIRWIKPAPLGIKKRIANILNMIQRWLCK